MSSDSDDDCLSRTMTSERSDADFTECFGDSLRKKAQPNDPFAPTNDDDYFLDNHSVVDGIYVSELVAPPEDEFPVGSKVFVVADLKELKQTMGPFFFEEKMFRLLGGARRITGKVLRHHGDYTVVQFSMPLEEMFSGTHTRKLGGAGGFRRTSLQHRKSISVSPTGETLYPNVSSSMSHLNMGNNNNSGGSGAMGGTYNNYDPLANTSVPPPMGAGGAGALLGETQRPSTSGVVGAGGGGATSSPSLIPQMNKLALGSLNLGCGGGGGGGSTSTPRRNTARGGPGSPRTPRGGAALLSPRSAAAQAERIVVTFTLHRSVIEVEEDC